MPKSDKEFKGLYLQIHAAVLIEEVEYMQTNMMDQSTEIRAKWKTAIEVLTDRITRIREFI
tara:strand:+ start:308 stop:490 length:183 start_codon:yes stop_codon:yes gene_type:complete